MDVGVWLRGLGLGQYETAFREGEIDAEILPDLTEGDLNHLGVPLGHRKRLLKAIAAFGTAEGASKPSSPAAASSLTGVAERRPITVMFFDLVGSTPLAAKLDAEDWRDLVGAYLDAASEAVTQMGGRVAKTLGDGLMALFGHPIAQENDSERAIRAALAIQRALVEINARNASRGAPGLSARIGLDSGQVVVDATGEVFGEAPNIAARVESAAEPGSILITAAVQRQTAGLFVAEDRGQHELKGVSAPMTLYRVIRASGAGRRGGGRALTSLVGRDEELDLLAGHWDRARQGEGQLALIVGEPGIGKSRLINEFHAHLGETPHTWVEWSSSQLLQNTPLHPIVEWGRQRFGADLPAEQRLADLENTLGLIGLNPTEYAPLLAPLVDVLLPEDRAAKLAPEELRRRQLAAMTAWILAAARTQAVVLAFEDLHWADPTSLDLLQALAERGAQAPLLILATARPEFRPPWSLGSHRSIIALSPLDRCDVAQMVGELASRHALNEEVVEAVSERTGGVPLFVEEVTRLLLERGEAGGLQAIPPTLQQSLAARLDRLGEAREVAQIGAVLGRDFTYALLRVVGGIDDPALQSALDRLADADLLISEGARSQGSYRFKHALIQDAAYESLLKSSRQVLHRRAAEILVGKPAAAEPEVIAHHFTQAGLDELAIEWWGKAGDQALRRSAFHEAIAHLGKAIAMADQAADPAARAAISTAEASQRVKLQNDYAQAVLWSKGYAADETKAAFERISALAARAELPAERFSALYGQYLWSWSRGEFRVARDTAERFLREAEVEGRIAEAKVAHITLGLACMQLGDLRGARTQLELGLSHFEEPGRELRDRFGLDGGASARAFLALTMWLSGDLPRARELIEEATRLAGEVGHPPTTAAVLMYKIAIETARNDFESVVVDAEKFLKISQQHNMGYNLVNSRLNLSLGRARLGNTQRGVDEFRKSLADYRDQGNRVGVPGYLGALARLEAAGQNYERALALIDEALMMSQEGWDRLYDSNLHRLRGNILLKRDPANPAQAEEAFKTSITIAKHQGARSFELLASLALAKLYRSTDHLVEAHAVLAPALEGFSPTPEMPVIAKAQTLVLALAETEEVRAAEARRRRLTQLHVAYGNAAIALHGFGAPETTEAFARARESASADRNAPGRLAADYGFWVGSFTRGELPSMRAHAAAFLGDIKARPDSPEAGVAHRAAGVTCWFAGQYREARDHLEQALDLFQAGRDDDLAFRFGVEPGTAAMVYLAFASWPLGEVDRAISLIDSMRRRIADLTHVGTLAFAIGYAAFFQLMRGDHGRAASNAFEFARLVRVQELPMFRAFGVFFEGWAPSAGGGIGTGLDDMRRGVEQLRQQNVLLFDGLSKIALAEAEAAAGDLDRALAVLDGGLATVERMGFRAFEAELHRVRGGILLKRDPASPAPAEDAFLTAIAVAKQQGTRSFALRAALSLAKLYRATGRDADAHEVLRPAIEGFAPTQEFPEIEEALETIAAIDADRHL
jgi:class 3 adenylate cyclase/tetratricopeptide (TPR) repeat protein